MPLRHSLAAVLQILRTEQGLTQQEIAGPLRQQTISELEAASFTATIETLQELATSLRISPASFFAMVVAAENQETTRHVLIEALQEVEALGKADEILERQPREIEHPRLAASRQKWMAIQALKKNGHTQAEVARALGYSKGTVWRLWEREPGSEPST